MGEVTVALTRGVSPPKTSMALPVTVGFISVTDIIYCLFQSSFNRMYLLQYPIRFYALFFFCEHRMM